VERSASANGWKVGNWWNGKGVISREKRVNKLNENL
jgi:hypothetical protein